MKLFRRTDLTSGQPAQFPRDTTRGEEKYVECCQDRVSWHWCSEGREPRRRATIVRRSLRRSPPPHLLPAPPVRRPYLQEPCGLRSMPMKPLGPGRVSVDGAFTSLSWVN